MFLNPNIFSNLNSNCSNSLDMRNLQEKVKKALLYHKFTYTAVEHANAFLEHACAVLEHTYAFLEHSVDFNLIFISGAVSTHFLTV